MLMLMLVTMLSISISIVSTLLKARDYLVQSEKKG